MTAVGENGRMPPGESWRRALAEANALHAQGSKRRYRIRSRLVEPGWWAYEAVPHGRIPTPEQVPLTRDDVAVLSRLYPRCAQRARECHGGGSKVAWTDQNLARRVAEALGQGMYLCKLPAPAIGEHWHTKTGKSKRRRG